MHSNYEKNRWKITFDCPLKKDTERSNDSAQQDTARNLTPRSIILRGTSEKYEYLGENETKKENILTHWSDDEKSWVLKISLDCPFNV